MFDIWDGIDIVSKLVLFCDDCPCDCPCDCPLLLSLETETYRCEVRCIGYGTLLLNALLILLLLLIDGGLNTWICGVLCVLLMLLLISVVGTVIFDCWLFSC